MTNFFLNISKRMLAAAVMVAMASTVAKAEIDNPSGAKKGEIYRWESNNIEYYEQLCEPENGVYGLFAFASDEHDWDSEFFIVIADELVPPGTKIDVKFEYRKREGSGVVKFYSQGHADPHIYINNDGWGQDTPLEATEEWQNYEGSFTVSNSNNNNGIRTLAVNASVGREDGTLLMRNIVIKVGGVDAIVTKETEADDAVDRGEHPVSYKQIIRPTRKPTTNVPYDLLNTDSDATEEALAGAFFIGKEAPGRFDGSWFALHTVKYGDDNVFALHVDTESTAVWDVQFVVDFSSVVDNVTQSIELSIDYKTDYEAPGSFDVHNNGNARDKWSFTKPTYEWQNYTDIISAEDIQQNNLSYWEFNIGKSNPEYDYNIFFKNVVVKVDGEVVASSNLLTPVSGAEITGGTVFSNPDDVKKGEIYRFEKNGLNDYKLLEPEEGKYSVNTYSVDANYYDSEMFFVLSDNQLGEGHDVHVKFDYRKVGGNVRFNAFGQTAPFVRASYDGWSELEAADKWQTYDGYFTISESMRIIGLNASLAAESARLELCNILVEVDGIEVIKTKRVVYPAMAKKGEIYRYNSYTTNEDELLEPEDGIYALQTFEEDKTPWDSKFFLVFADDLLPAGTWMRVRFDYRKEGGAVQFISYGEGDPHDYVNNDGFGMLEATDKWQTIDTIFTTSGEIRSLSANASYAREDATLYFRNIIVEVDFEEVINTAYIVYADSDLAYTIVGGVATVTGYIGTSQSVTIPATITVNGKKYPVTSIGDNVFNFCQTLESIIIPNSVKTIGDYAFYCCTGLTSIEIPESVKSIGKYAFYGCENLTEVKYNPATTTVGEGAFEGTKIQNEDLDQNQVIIDGVIYKVVGSEATVAGYSKDANITKMRILENVTIDAADYPVTSIGSFAFSNCQTIQSVIVGNTVTSIGQGAFANCHNIRELEISNSVETIGNKAFYGCHKLATVVVPRNAQIGESTFSYVKNVDYYGNSTDAPWGALTLNGFFDDEFIYSDSKMTKITAYIGNSSHVTIPERVTNIGYMSFFESDNLESVRIPNTVKYIGGSAFANCYKLGAVNVPLSVVSV
ncbi:MAG: leucine-rich repeat domain-containing protein, partial [Salinivirgaceae bacterium]|nr:leucine-rich repeat domain-containing protein [Salinivirgaceae bacterium]